jgi:hypothetical protein
MNLFSSPNTSTFALIPAYQVTPPLAGSLELPSNPENLVNPV